MTVLMVVLLWASVALQARIYVRHMSGQSPRRLPTLKKRGDRCESQ